MKLKFEMSYNNNPNPYSNKMSYSNLSKKNQMILKLKQEIVEQKQKEDEYNELLNEVQLLESRMDNLTLEKVFFFFNLMEILIL